MYNPTIQKLPASSIFNKFQVNLKNDYFKYGH